MQAANALSNDQFGKLLDFYMLHPGLFIEDVMGAQPWEKQQEIIDSTFKYKVTAVKTCNAIGKSFIAARIVVAYLMLHPNSIVVTTAPTWRQVTDVLWREIGTAIKQAEMKGFKLTENEVKKAGLDMGTDWFAVGLSTSRPENFFGYHADHILVVVDEAGGVDEAIFKGVAAITPNKNAHVLLIGNPTDPSGTFYNYFNKPELGANCITVSAFDTPNFTACGIRNVQDLLEKFTPQEGFTQAEWTVKVNAELEELMNPVYAGLIAPSVVYGRYFEWGTDSAAWQSLIMGEFPDQAPQSLIPANLVRMAMKMYDTDMETGQSYEQLFDWQIPEGPMAYGQDMARFGGDLNVNYGTHGGWVDEPVIWNKKGDEKLDLVQSAMRILQIIDFFDPEVSVNIDDTGNGGGTTDKLREESRKSVEAGKPAHLYVLRPYVMSAKNMMTELEKVKFADITSKVYWNLRQWFYKKKIGLHFDQELYDELVSRRWSIDKSGRIKVESKEEFKKRTGGSSPDRSDALALAFANKKPEAVEAAALELTVVEEKPVVMVGQTVTTEEDLDALLDRPPVEVMAPLTSGFSQRH